jgi:hypothetical protein
MPQASSYEDHEIDNSKIRRANGGLLLLTKLVIARGSKLEKRPTPRCARFTFHP